MYNAILSKILKRDTSIFNEDMKVNQSELEKKISGSRILVIGAAGSVGSGFVRQITRYNLACLHLVDISENNLVEVVRDLRSSDCCLPDNFTTVPIALGSLEFEKFLDSEKKYDYILNFSAIKHVRSEKDPFCLMRMYNTNVLYVKKLLDILTTTGMEKFFSVSSDKAVNPANVMGATKAFMERVLFLYSDKIPISTARFANVAFSDGSLLYGFNKRLEKRQPLSAPTDVRRYFISYEEAGQLCLLSCFIGHNRDIFFPKPERNLDLISFSDIAEIYLRSHGLEPEIFFSEREAKKAALRINKKPKKWPCYFFSSDTTGEKPYEEFYSTEDEVDFTQYKSIGVINFPEFKEDKKILNAIEEFERITKSKIWYKDDMVRAIKMAVPKLNHKEKNKNLDSKM